jgi:hypothetical protein
MVTAAGETPASRASEARVIGRGRLETSGPKLPGLVQCAIIESRRNSALGSV